MYLFGTTMGQILPLGCRMPTFDHKRESHFQCCPLLSSRPGFPAFPEGILTKAKQPLLWAATEPLPCNPPPPKKKRKKPRWQHGLVMEP